MTAPPPSPCPGDVPASPGAPLVLALTTEASEAQALALAQALLQRRLVACVSLRPLRSLYRWQGRIADTQEVELLLKTTPGQLPALEAAVRALHSYDTPEWLSWCASASGAYAAWVWEATSSLSDP